MTSHTDDGAEGGKGQTHYTLGSTSLFYPRPGMELRCPIQDGLGEWERERERERECVCVCRGVCGGVYYVYIYIYIYIIIYISMCTLMCLCVCIIFINFMYCYSWYVSRVSHTNDVIEKD